MYLHPAVTNTFTLYPKGTVCTLWTGNKLSKLKSYTFIEWKRIPRTKNKIKGEQIM